MRIAETEEQCRRLARAISSDITLYNEELVAAFRRDGVMPPKLKETVEEGRTLYFSRTVPAYADLFDAELDGFLGQRGPHLTVREKDIPSNTPEAASSYRASSGPYRREKESHPELIVLALAVIVGAVIAYFALVQ